MITIYYSPGSCSLASLIALEESGLMYQARRVDFSQSEQQSPDYLAVNPKGRVPALVSDRGVVTETSAILAYIAQISPRTRLAPTEDFFEFARMQAFNNYLSSTVHVNHAHGRRGGRWSDDPAAQESMKAKVAENMAASFELIESQMFKGPWVMGEAYSVADGYLYTMTRWLPGDGVDVPRFSRIAEHYNRMQERPAVQRALAVHGQ